jgi:transcriptional regulator with XRE-family HTH domain
MLQPKLGKKIAALRKSNGLTQEELVEKCKLNVRTLQRIEAGEVTPRSYTIRQIFNALGQEAYTASKENKVHKFYAYALDLFNLKTNIMKKLTLLTAILLMLSTIIFTACYSTRQRNSPKGGLIGTWISVKNGVPDTLIDSKPGQVRIKTIAPGRFVMTFEIPKQNISYLAFTGSLTSLTDTSYTEAIETTGGGGFAKYMDGRIGTYTYKISGSMLTVKGVNNPWIEVWKRVK